MCKPRTLFAALFIALCASVAAQEPAARKVAISFLPPPLEGTISLGIYDSKGALVRVLHREADVDEFEIGADALKTTWDGKNNAGEAVPAGKYHARGYALGDAEVDGIGYFFNDWITDEETPRLRSISRLLFEDAKLIVLADLSAINGSEASEAPLWCDDRGTVKGPYGNFIPAKGSTHVGLELPPTIDLVAWAFGPNDSIWLIDRTSKGAKEREVKQFSKAGELVRRLAIPAEDPQPISIAASKTEDRIFLLEEND
ncbi:MAG TPA: hypothetical protein VF551_03785, partial [Chthoniobacterales bacterium]